MDREYYYSELFGDRIDLFPYDQEVPNTEGLTPDKILDKVIHPEEWKVFNSLRPMALQLKEQFDPQMYQKLLKIIQLRSEYVTHSLRLLGGEIGVIRVPLYYTGARIKHIIETQILTDGRKVVKMTTSSGPLTDNQFCPDDQPIYLLVDK